MEQMEGLKENNSWDVIMDYIVGIKRKQKP